MLNANRHHRQHSTVRTVPLIVLLGLLSLSSFSVGAAVIFGEEFRPFLWGPQMIATDQMEYSVAATSTGGQSNVSYVNVVRDDGTWIVQNLAVGLDPGTRRVATNIPLGLFDASRIYQTTTATSPVSTSPAFGAGTVRVLSAPVLHQFNNPFGVVDEGPLGLPDASENRSGSRQGQPIFWALHTGVPDLAQGPDECVPTSTANSILWLDQQHRLGLNMSANAVVSELVTDMRTNVGTPGTSIRDFLRGKNKFVMDHGLQITTHEVDNDIGDILDEFLKGQDIELDIKWSRGGGHFVTLVGIGVRGIPGDFDFLVRFHDPDDDVAGSPHRDVVREAEWVDPFFGPPRLVGYPRNTVVRAFAESVVPEPSTAVLITLAIIIMLLLIRADHIHKLERSPSPFK